MSRTLRVLISGANGQIASHLIPLVCQGLVCGEKTKIDLVLHDLAVCMPALNGLKMEIEDCSYPLLKSITCTSDYAEAFAKTDLALLVGGKPRGPGMERKDLILDNAKIFIEMGHFIREYAPAHIRVVVIANPANTNCWILFNVANSTRNRNTDNANNTNNENNNQAKKQFDPKNFTALTRLDHDRALSQFAKKTSSSIDQLSHMTIWGNHSSTMVPDITYTQISSQTAPPATLQLSPTHNTLEVPNPPAGVTQEWYDGEFVDTVQQRGAKVIQVRGKSSAMSAANAISNHVFQWLHGDTRHNLNNIKVNSSNPVANSTDWTSMAIISDGQYGVAKGLVFSFPCTFLPISSEQNKTPWKFQWHVVEKLVIHTNVAKRIATTMQELIREQGLVRNLVE